MKRDKVLMGFLISVGFLFGICAMVRFISGVQQEKLMKSSTSPLPFETIQNLCSKFKLHDNHELCHGEKYVYSWDFSEVIYNSFLPEGGDSATYETVEGILGNYKIECEPPVHQADGLNYYRCHYDFLGDSIHNIQIYFSHPEDIVFRISFDFDLEGDND